MIFSVPAPFIVMKYPSLSMVIIFVLNSILPSIEIIIPNFFRLLFQ